MSIYRELDALSGGAWLARIQGLFAEAELPDYVKIAIDADSKRIELTWHGGEKNYSVYDRISSVLGSSPHYSSREDGWDVIAWWNLTLHLKRNVPAIALGYAALASALAGECRGCVHFSDDEAVYYAFTEACERDGGERLESHQQLAEIAKVIGEKTLKDAAEYVSAFVSDPCTVNDAQAAVHSLGHFSGIVESSRALAEQD